MRLTLSIIASLAILVYAVVSLAYGPGLPFMNDQLSFKHRMLVSDCSRCHTPWLGVRNESCQECHGNIEHSDPKKVKVKSVCSSCHREHGGREHSLTFIADNKCTGCHNEKTFLNSEHKTKVKSARSGVLLTHRTFFARGVYMENLCANCHLKHTLRLKKGEPLRGIKDVMINHVLRPETKCSDCHREIQSERFTASGGGLDPAKCVDCHRKKLVSVSCSYCHIFHHHESESVVAARAAAEAAVEAAKKKAATPGKRPDLSTLAPPPEKSPKTQKGPM